jgi:hypothetical protein
MIAAAIAQIMHHTTRGWYNFCAFAAANTHGVRHATLQWWISSTFGSCKRHIKRAKLDPDAPHKLHHDESDLAYVV